MIKARLDLPNNTTIVGSYVKADIESDKDGEDGVYDLVGDDQLESEYEGITGKVSTRLGNLRLAARANVYEIDGPEYSVYFDQRDVATKTKTPTNTAEIAALEGSDIDNYEATESYLSAESREVTELGFDAVYRLARYTTLRLDYEYEEVDRDEEELGETETHTIKAAVNTRVAKGLSARVSYEYQDIDEPFAGAHVGIAQDGGITDPAYPGLAWYITEDYLNIDGNNDDVMYWNSVYPARGLESTNRPDQVHEVKLNTTWSPASNMAATLFARVRYQDNDDVKYEQTTYVPGVSLWYAPNSKLNLTMFYTFNRQETENQMCVGWYHG
jgi:hypothetical protein